MSELFDAQLLKKKLSLFHQSLRSYEASLGVWIQKIPAAQLVRILKDANAEDPVYRALIRSAETFSGCAAKDVDMAGCLQTLELEHAKDKRNDGCALLAWAQTYGSPPHLVGMMTLHNFIESTNFSNTPQTLHGTDYKILRPYFGTRYVYIDCLCSVRVGVGRLLIHHATKYAIAKKKEGVIALAFSQRASARPESASAFVKCAYEALIPQANFRVQMYGTWYVKRVRDVSLDGMDEAAFRVCARPGLTPRTRDTLVWRCPP